jgi:prepilin-type N-terminal cleavage/methylation domain-containing protein
MRTKIQDKSQAGFSIAEMMVTILIMLVVMGAVSSLFSRSFSTRTRESSKTDALTAAQAALNVMSREIGNSGYGLITNGLATDSGAAQLHFVSNIRNTDELINAPGEDVTYFFEPATRSILRHDRNANGLNNPETSIIINQISNVQFQYFDYLGSNALPTGPNNVPTFNTGRVRITLTVNLENVINQVNPDRVILTSDVTLRNADYMLRQY